MIKEIPEVIVCTMEQRLKFYDDLFEYMPEMGAYMEETGCVCAKPEYCFTHYLEPGYKEEDILVEVCEAVTEKKADYGKLKFKVFPAIISISEAIICEKK